MLDLSIIIPTFDEEDNVGPLYEALMATVPPLGRSFEIIFVDDGSRDQTFPRLAAIAARDPRVRVILEGEALTVTHYRIDQSHSNAYAEWVRQGRPMYPTPEQRAAIKAREGLELLEPPRPITPVDGCPRLTFSLPVHGVSLVVVEAG